MSKQQIKIADVYRLLSKASEIVHFANFTKRGDGEERQMVFRIAGSDDNCGEPLPIHRVMDDINSEILTVWDMNKRAYRRINLRKTHNLVVDQQEYEVIP